MNKQVMLLLTAMTFVSCSAVPTWFMENTKTPDYIVGVGSAKIENKDMIQARSKAEEDALYLISRQLYSEVESITIDQQQESNANKNILVGSYFLKDVQIKSALKLSNYEVSNQAAAKNVMYVLVKIKRSTMINSYSGRIKKQIEQIKERFSLANRVSQSDRKQALDYYQSIRSDLADLDTNILILQALTDFQTDLNASITSLPSQAKLDEAIMQLTSNQKQEYGDLAEEIISQINMTIPAGTSFICYPYEWGNSSFCSTFGANFSQYLSGTLATKLNWIDTRGKNDCDLSVTGQMIDSGKAIYLQTRISYGKQEQVLTTLVNSASCEYYGWDNLKPKDLEQKLADKKIMKQKYDDSGKLKAEICSLEFERNPAVYYFNDTPTILVRANQACYMTVLYIEADGTRTVLKQNYRVSDDLANEWVILPASPCACEPAGVEQLLLQADVVPLPILNTTKVDMGNDMFKDIVKAGLRQTVALTRGMKQKEKASQYCEDTLTWTVLAHK